MMDCTAASFDTVGAGAAESANMIAGDVLVDSMELSSDF